MSSAISSILDRGRSRLEANLGQPFFTFGWAKFPCIPSTNRAGEDVEFGGIANTVAMTFIVRRDAFGNSTLPVIGQDIVFNSETLRVMDWRLLAGGGGYEFDVSKPDR